MPNDQRVRFMVVDPGHFHAGLVLKEMYGGDDETTGRVDDEVFVYAPDGPELDDFLALVERYNQRKVNPTHWNLQVYRGDDFFKRMIRDHRGNVLVLAGNNQKKTEYILEAVRHGLNVYSDKPMAINGDDFQKLREAFKIADEKGLLLYDIMTERFEITSILQKELMHMPLIFGSLLTGSEDEPAVIKESVHNFFKYVSGKRLQRPPWFFDVEQEGEGLVDVTTHLVDLVQWACFPGEIIDTVRDLKLLDARHWPTLMTPQQFSEVTGVAVYPDYLKKEVNDQGNLEVYSNGVVSYQLKGIHVRVQVEWKYRAPEGGGDTHFSVVRGSLADLEIRQGAPQGFRPELYLIPKKPSPDYLRQLDQEFKKVAEKYPGITLEKSEGKFRVNIPDHYRNGHEAHFGQVTQNFLKYLHEGHLPGWEVPDMLAKYYLTTQALQRAHQH